MFADHTLITEDGVGLASRLWRPDGAGPWPCLLMRQPYGRAIASTVTLPHPDWWCGHGFMVIVQDVRGQGDSDGVFEGFSQEARDTATTLEWIRNHPDCNGRIGLYGFSYQGLTQLLAPEDSLPPDCMAPAMCGLDEQTHWSCEGGAHWWHLGLGWGLQLAALQARRRGDQSAWGEIRESLESGRYLRDGPDLLERHDPNGMALRWLKLPADQADGWKHHHSPRSWLRRPLLLLGGWWDPHLRGVLDLAERSRAAGGSPELHIGPATHLQWWPQSSALLLNFFRRHLQDLAAADDAELLRLWDQGSDQWVDLPWRVAGGPTPDAIGWHLASDGLACLDPNEGRLLNPPEGSGGTVTVVHDPWRPVPAVGGHLSPSAGPCDRSSIDQRSDVALFTSAPLQASMVLCGRPVLSCEASADQPGFDLSVTLSRLPAGSTTTQQLSTGLLRVLGDRARQSEERCVELQPMLASFQAGDRLRLSIAGAAWPAVGVNPGTLDHLCGAPHLRCQVISIALQLKSARLQMETFLMLHNDGTPAD